MKGWRDAVRLTHEFKGTTSESEPSHKSSSTPSSSGKQSGIIFLEAIDGVQPELQESLIESERSRIVLLADNCPADLDELLGPLPLSKTLFKNKHFLLTCTIVPKSNRLQQNMHSQEFIGRMKQYLKVPFIKSHIKTQLEAGGGIVLNHFEEIPKTKQKTCKLIAPRPCATSKYIQCLAVNMTPLSHEWVIESCRLNKLLDQKKYILPAGWSITKNRFINFPNGRRNILPFSEAFIYIVGFHDDYRKFWERVCKMAGAKIRIVNTANDITAANTGYLIHDFDDYRCDININNIKQRAEHCGISVVSTTWIVESLILGKICEPEGHRKFKEIYHDDDL